MDFQKFMCVDCAITAALVFVGLRFGGGYFTSDVMIALLVFVASFASKAVGSSLFAVGA